MNTNSTFSVTGDAIIEGAISKKSGLVYERRLIEKYVTEEGKCPITNEPLTPDDIIVIKSAINY